uniref:CBM20 domain-containing protein n=1 Tax=Chromera velia CCMP2878 TaxID=1169474 RepID=A0A0G4G4I2_9ALVE|eukprot:Cvel_20102.t1-p1 / transcript=Cvel_20102.t1 / gene=Cvel_20102 / organism=Chromera_velia_CCMP2878 / gene_product=Zinc finger protein 283, putative / transcript_product=Zinc finger protein 283, putative / location=Cvel_scaffold1780:10885-12914(-) / protein_length=591 / sequence_SO=supercontig / SO=protein_coding / is_pseudo=false
MKSFVAFVAHCAELGENQRVVVVGECPELGGWDLGGALCMRPAPCGRPLWVSSEVEVDLSESPFGASGVSAYGMGMRGESGGVGLGVSELKFRLVAIPNEADAVTVSDPLHLICLEPLKGGDFRVVRLLDGVAPVDSSLVGARGVNIIHVGAKGGGEQQQNPEVVGISVEWGIPESVQLGLLPLHPNRHTEHPQKESEHAGLSGPQSETACPPSAQRRAQPDSRRFEPTDENEDKSAVSVCHHQSAVKFTESGAQEVCIRPADLKSHNRILPSPPSNSSDLQLSSHDRTCHRRHETEGEGAHSSGVALKRQRSEGALCQVEADDCDHVSGCPGERHGGASSGGGSGSSCLREEKQRRLTVSIPEFAPLSSECSRGRGDPVARGRAVVSGKGCLEREGEGGEVQRDVGVGSDRTRRAFTGEVKRDGSGNILCPHGRTVEGRAYVSTVDSAFSAKSVEGKAFASMDDGAVSARSVEARASVSTVAGALSARSVEARASVSTVDCGTGAKSVEARASVSTVAGALSARSVEGRASVSTVGSATTARTVEGTEYVFTESTAATARSASCSQFFSIDPFPPFPFPLACGFPPYVRR